MAAAAAADAAAGRGAAPEPAAAPAASRRRRPKGSRPTAQPRAKRKDNGSDLIVRNLVTGQEITIPLVSDFAWSKDGSWLAYAVSSAKAEEDGAFARKMSDGTIVALHKGKGNYKSLAFDDAGAQLAFLSDQAEYRQGRVAVSPLLLEGRRRRGRRARVGGDARHAAGHGA